MILESFPPLETVGVELEEVPTGPLLRGAKLPTLKDRLTLGIPLFVPITNDYHPDDADLQAFIRGSEARWVLAHLALTFEPSEGPPLQEAKVGVNLRDDGASPDTIAFSILPVHEGTPYETTRSFTLSPNVTVGTTVGISLGSYGSGSTQHGESDFVLGFDALTPHPRWEFKSTATQKLVGGSRLSMILRVPKDRTGTAAIDLSAKIENGPFYRRRRVPLQPQAGEGHVEANF